MFLMFCVFAKNKTKKCFHELLEQINDTSFVVRWRYKQCVITWLQLNVDKVKATNGKLDKWSHWQLGK